MMTITQSEIPAFLQLAQALNSDITQDWTEFDWLDDRKLGQLCWKVLKNVNLVNPDTAAAIKRQVQWMQANPTIKVITFEIAYNVYRLTRTAPNS
jgi:hypothetical protein